MVEDNLRWLADAGGVAQHGNAEVSLPHPSKARCLPARNTAAGIECDSDVLVARRLAASLEKANAIEHVNVMVDRRTQSMGSGRM
mmetsp:Transcript_26160/g.59795  ORF Transcript_26160/g.59795 Transcript_26160/m.59795 type:complete len:85 (-) Transcript_26160:176-430(-)